MIKALIAKAKRAFHQRYASHIYVDGALYMKRWRFGRPDGFGVRLHHIHRPDPDQELHDHPFDFVSVILSGGYWEETLTSGRLYSAGDVIFRQAETLHRLKHVAPHTWTLVFRGPYRKPWGFVPRDWTDWRDYVRQKRDVTVMDFPSLDPHAAESST